MSALASSETIVIFTGRQIPAQRWAPEAARRVSDMDVSFWPEGEFVSFQPLVEKMSLALRGRGRKHLGNFLRRYGWAEQITLVKVAPLFLQELQLGLCLHTFGNRA